MRLAFYLVMVISLMMIFGCAGGYYNTQKGAALGAAAGALYGQAIGGDTESTLIGTGAGALLGTILGNAADQEAAMIRDSRYRQQSYQQAPSRRSSRSSSGYYGSSGRSLSYSEGFHEGAADRYKELQDRERDRGYSRGRGFFW